MLRPPLRTLVTTAMGLALATPAPSRAGLAPQAPAAVAALSRDLELARKSWTFASWPGRAHASCHSLQGDGSEHDYAELWCDECIVNNGAFRGAFRFYPDVRSGTCTLQEVEAELGEVWADRGEDPDERLDQLAAVVVPVLGAETAGPPFELPEVRVFDVPRRWWSTRRDLAYLYDDTAGVLPRMKTPP